MPSNDLLLLDSLIRKSRSQYGSRRDDAEYFELFCIDNVLKNFELSLDEIVDGWVDGPDDGGIDAIFTFIDGTLLSDRLENQFIRNEPFVEVYILSMKHGDSFKQSVVTSLFGTLIEWFDLRNENLANVYNDQIIDLRERFRAAYLDLADKTPRISLNVLYCSRGDTSHIAENVRGKADQLIKALSNLFSRSSVTVNFLGASELLRLAQRKKRYSLNLKYTETFISRGANNYVLLCRLRDYLRFITDEDGRLRHYLFDANVRAYLGGGQVNADIAHSLASPDGIDFWWLNNGITVLASNATVVGKEINIENVLIVNGLQTTETIYRILHDRTLAEDDRAVLVKIVISHDDIVRNKIVKATNYQSSVELTSLRSSDQIQKNIEHYFLDHGWYYERRTNFYRNQRKNGDRIVSISQLGASVRALVFRAPRTAATKTRWHANENSYRELFNDRWPLELFLACANIVRSVEITLRTSEEIDLPKPIIQGWRYLVSLILVVIRFGTIKYESLRVCELAHAPIEAHEVEAAIGHVLGAFQESSIRPRTRVNAEEEEMILARLEARDFVPLEPSPYDPNEGFVFVKESDGRRRRGRRGGRRNRRGRLISATESM